MRSDERARAAVLGDGSVTAENRAFSAVISRGHCAMSSAVRADIPAASPRWRQPPMFVPPPPCRGGNPLFAEARARGGVAVPREERDAG